jgi:hypothetical protein
MPYRRLPNTDAARLKALNTAYSVGREFPPFQLAFSQSTFQRIQSFLPSFEKALLETKQTYETQVERNKEYVKLMKKAKLYVSHFIQIVNMAILRNDLPASERSFFGLDEDEKKTPVINTEMELLDWGKKIIDGEEHRKTSGRSPITNPSIALVRVRYEQFTDAYKFQKTLQKNYQRSHDNLASIRPMADDIILNIWNEVEQYYNDLQENERKQKCEKYGLNYVYRKNEIVKLNSIEKN